MNSQFPSKLSMTDNKKQTPHVVRIRVLGLAGISVRRQSDKRWGGHGNANSPTVLPPSQMRASVILSREGRVVRSNNSNRVGSPLSLPLRESRKTNDHEVSSLLSSGERYLAVWESSAIEEHDAEIEDYSVDDALVFDTTLQGCETGFRLSDKTPFQSDDKSMNSITTSMYAPKSFMVGIALSNGSSNGAFPLGVATLPISGDECLNSMGRRVIDLPVLNLSAARGPLFGDCATLGPSMVDLKTGEQITSTKEMERRFSPTLNDTMRKDGDVKKKRFVKKLLSFTATSNSKKGKISENLRTPHATKHLLQVFSNRFSVDASGDAVIRLSVEAFPKECSDAVKLVELLAYRKKEIEAPCASPLRAGKKVINASGTPSIPKNPTTAIITPGTKNSEEMKFNNRKGTYYDVNASITTTEAVGYTPTVTDGTDTCFTGGTYDTTFTGFASARTGGGETYETGTTMSRGEHTAVDLSFEDTVDTTPTFVTRQVFGRDMLVPSVAVEASQHIMSVARDAADSGKKTGKSLEAYVDILMARCGSSAASNEPLSDVSLLPTDSPNGVAELDDMERRKNLRKQRATKIRNAHDELKDDCVTRDDVFQTVKDIIGCGFETSYASESTAYRATSTRINSRDPVPEIVKQVSHITIDSVD